MSGTKYVSPDPTKPVRRFKWPNYVIYEGGKLIVVINFLIMLFICCHQYL